MVTDSPLRCGLVGTGHWAQINHAPALASTDGIQFTAVWGRDPAAAQALAAAHDAVACSDLDAFLARVDAVVFAVPPDVQSEIAVRAAQAGKHLLLEKPLALTVPAADAVAQAVARAHVASIVFFTARFDPRIRAWLTEVTSQGRWYGARSAWLGTSLAESNPFRTPWRQEKGGLWDLGPHVVSLLWASLGPVVAVTADVGLPDVTHLVLHHDNGASSTATVTLNAPPAADGLALSLWGEPGQSAAPLADPDSLAALRVALTELAANVRSGRTDHPCDASFGRDVVHVLAAAEQQIKSRPAGGIPIAYRLDR
jgi:predicted dehydrogenase